MKRNSFKKGHTLGFKKGSIPWNKGSTHSEETKKKLSEKAKKQWQEGRVSKVTQFKKGHVTHNKGKPGPRGENANNWKGGITPIRNKIRGLLEYKQWRAKVFSRDNFTCLLCQKRGGSIEADHFPKLFSQIIKNESIQSLDDAVNSKSLWDVDNGRTLCEECHSNFGVRKFDGRAVFIDELTELAKKDKKIVLITMDVGFSFLERFKEMFPDRYFNFGITEPTSMVIASALALDGWKPYIYSMANFVTFRTCEQVRNAVVRHFANVKIIGVKGSEKYKFLGFSHNLQHENEDVNMCKNIGLDSFVSTTEEDTRRIIKESYENEKPIYIRL